MLSNPIFQKEMKTSVRDPKIIVMILGFLTMLSMIMIFLWPKTGIYSQRSSAGMQVFSIFLLSNLVLIILVVPALTSPCITSEREANSYELLFTSLLTPGEILRGKLLSAISMILLVILVSIPVSALCSLSGGIPPSLLFKAMSIIVVSALTYGMISLAVSALCKSTFTSLISSYLAVMFFAGCTWLPSVLVRSKLFNRPLAILRCISPFDAMMSILFPTRYNQFGTSGLMGNTYFYYYMFLFLNIVLIACALLIFCKYVVSPPKSGLFYTWAGWILTAVLAFAILVQALIGWGYFQESRKTAADQQARRARMTQVSKGKNANSKRPRRVYKAPNQSNQNLYLIAVLVGIVDMIFVMLIRSMFHKAASANAAEYEDHFTDTKTMVKRKLTWPFYLIDPLKRKKPIGRFRNPVFIAEMRSQLFAKPRFIIYGLTACMSFSMVLLILTCFQFGEWLTPERVLPVAIIFQVGLISVLAPSISSGSITNEITARTFPMLRMTPMPATKMVFGKLKASFLYVSIFLISGMPALFALAYLDYSKEIAGFQAFWRVGAWLAILVVVTATLIAAGFCCSAFSTSTSTATALSYCFAAVLCIVTLAGMIPDAFPDQVEKALLTLNPIVVAVRLTSDKFFTNLPQNAWVTNLIFLGSLTGTMIVLSCIRVYYIFIRRS